MGEFIVTIFPLSLLAIGGAISAAIALEETDGDRAEALLAFGRTVALAMAVAAGVAIGGQWVA